MARYTGPVCKLCRREGMKLLLKGERCLTAKCAFERRGFPPGQHGQNRRFKQSDFGHQLREKQKIRRSYGMLERQFRNTYEKAVEERGVTGENMLVRLETRLDNVVFRLGMAPSLQSARQLVNHGHFTVNGRKVDIPSYMLRVGDVVSVRARSKKLELIHEAMQHKRPDQLVPYLSLDKAKMEGSLLARPKRVEIPITAREQLVVELYSR
ncbi:MAG: 30S ribosomal protein S4 [Candidatus Electryoneaceae bacterium]|nr:30S ribosomal protein S4 [Candidatus Electryoneaceae bacterium]